MRGPVPRNELFGQNFDHQSFVGIDCIEEDEIAAPLWERTYLGLIPQGFIDQKLRKAKKRCQRGRRTFNE